MFKVESSIQMDAPQLRRECPYPFAQMAIGDSFHVDADVSSVGSKRGSIQQWVRRYRRATGQRSFSVATRSTDSGFRVWRTA